MAGLLDNSRSKFDWAEKRFTDLQREVEKFWQLHPYKQVTEPHPDKPDYQQCKIIPTESFPPDIAHITAEVVSSLRSALDGAGYAVAVAAGTRDPKSSAFPFAGSAEGMAKALNGRCKDIPPPIQSLFCGFQPYPGGNEFLWALNEVCNTHKHKIVMPIVTASAPRGLSLEATGGYMSIPDPPTWDSMKHEMLLATFGPGVKFDYEFNFSFFVAFGEVRLMKGKDLLRTLDTMGRVVKSILVAIEAESRRIGLIK